MANTNPYPYSYPTSQVSLNADRIVKQERSSYFQKLKRRWKPALFVFLLTMGSSVAFSMFLKKEYSAFGKLLFKPNATASLTGVAEEATQLSNLLVDQTPLSNEIQRMKSSSVLLKAIEKLGLKDEEGELLTPEDMAKKLRIKLVGSSDVIEIRYQDTNPELAAKVVNELMGIYRLEQIRSNQDKPTIAKEFISGQIPSIRTKVEEAESELEEFKAKNNIVDLPVEKKEIVRELGNYNREISNLGASFEGVKAQTSVLQDQLGLSLQQAIYVNQLSNAPVVNTILDELGNTEAQLAEERKRFKDTHPNIVSIKEKKQILNGKLQNIIIENLGTGVNISEGLLANNNSSKENTLEKFITLKIQELSLQKQLNSYYDSQKVYLTRSRELPRLEKKEQELIRKVETANKTYTTLLESLQELELAQNQQTSNVEIIEEAKPPREGNSGRIPLLTLGLLSALLLSNLTTIFLEMKDRTIRSIADIKQQLSYKILGIIPQNNSFQPDKGVTVMVEPDSQMSEIYRSILANFKFTNVKRIPKTILITSSIPGEGKSTITANLAAASSELGKKVLLIDGDLRKSNQHKLWQLSNHQGLDNIINEGKAFRDIVFPISPTLDILTPGKINTNPLAIIDSLEMSQLIGKVKKQYDLIFIDSPPLPVSADVLTLSKLVDGILFVCRADLVEENSLNLAKETLTFLEPKILGTIINGVNKKEFKNYSYYARYSSY